MNKWYQPFGLLLVAAMVGDLSGCAQTGNWLSKKSTKKSDEKVASSDKKASSKSSRNKTAKQIADAKSDQMDTRTAKGAKPKGADSERDKFAAADRTPKKSGVSQAVAKNEDSKADLAKSNSSAASVKPKKPERSRPKTEEDLDAFLAQAEMPIEPKRTVAKKGPAADLEETEESGPPAKRNVVQVKKEVSKDEEDDVADWATIKAPSNAKPAKATRTADASDEEWDSASAPKAKSKSQESRESWSDSESDEPAKAVSKSSPKKEPGRGLQDLCPQATGELRELLKNLNPDDAESLKQGLNRIGQMRTQGAAAAPLLRKMLKHEDVVVRLQAALAMSRLNMTSAESVAVVTDSLKSRNASLRSFGSAVVGEMGPRSADVLASLSESLNDRDGQIRLRAAEVLIRHEEYSYQALQTLLSCLRDKDENVRWLTTYSLAELAPESTEVVQALLKASRDPVQKVSLGAVWALGEIGPYAQRATDDLRRLLETTKDEELKSAINHTIPKMNKDAQ